MGLLDFFKRRKPEAAARQEPVDPLLSQIAAAYPKGPVRRGSFKGVPRFHDLTGKAPVIDEVMVFDAEDHWFFLFLGCRPLGLPFELSFRTTKAGSEPPPDWCVEPVTRVANMIGDGAECAPGVTWVIGSPIGDASSAFVGFMALPDMQFGDVEPARLLQLVPVTRAELDMHGPDHVQLCRSLESDHQRMMGVPGSHGS
ncbi:MAG: suppressor of fused domain protein [Deltaproteobacteria bacterium]|nr:suppressor of fused domain protein [Deltaproteobacteria bacterium]